MAAQQAQSVWANLPKEIIETLGLCLDASGWAAARGTCLSWSKAITHGINLLEIDLERDAHRYVYISIYADVHASRGAVADAATFVSS